VEPWEAVIRLIAAFLITGLIGWERKQASKPAGARTHALVGLTAALYALLGDLSPQTLQTESVRTDPVRTIQAIATGVGFLGAGMIFREAGRVQGLTTAASIWASAAVGVAVAWSHWTLAAAGSILILIALRWPFKEKKPVHSTKRTVLANRGVQ
jgi:putative Mg2+ transporter-C (MgtC) family protein